MPIYRSESQGGGSGLEVKKHYFPRKDDPEYRIQSYTSMRSFIDRLDSEFKDTNIWLLTSHDNLLLMSGPKYTDTWHVGVHTLQDTFSITYPMTEESAPFRGATVNGDAKGLEEGFRIALIAMDESRGWTNSEELKRLVEPGSPYNSSQSLRD